MPEKVDNGQKQRNIFAFNFKKCLDIAHKTQADIVRDLGVTSSTVSDWANAKKYPRVDKMQSLADYLGVLLSDLREEKPATDESDELFKAIFADARKARFAKWLAGLDDRGLDRIEKLLDAVEMLPKE